MKNRNTFKTTFHFLVGSEADFEPEHRFLNITCLMMSFSYFLTVPINTLLDMNLHSRLINFCMAIMLTIIYIISRFKKKIVITTSLLIISVCFTLSIDFFLIGGMASGMPYYFFSLLVIILFLFEGKRRILISVLIIIIINALFFLEYFNPQWIIDSPANYQLLLDHFVNFNIALPFVILAVYFSKQLYKKEKMNTISIVEDYRRNGEFLKRQMDKKFEQLSIREREVFQLIIQGKSNKEIADKLFIEVGTVKIHINKVYKKLGTIDRRRTINYAIKHKKPDISI